MNLLLLALVPACFALNPVIGRAMADAFGPASLSVVRWLLSALVIALIGAALAWYHAVAVLLVVAGLMLINRGSA